MRKIITSAPQNVIEEAVTVTTEQIEQALEAEINAYRDNENGLLLEIQELINQVIRNIQEYQVATKNSRSGSVLQKAQELELRKNLIYKDFFLLQNKINLFLHQKVVITYVHVDPITGKREIRLVDNDIEHLQVAEMKTPWGSTYAKLHYDINSHYQQLLNSLPREENETLQETALQVELRWQKFKKQIIWRHKEDDRPVGYILYNRGPINEAFVDFYIRNVRLKSSLNNNIHDFMVSVDPKGVIQADNANGFLIGDTSLNRVQYAVKGLGGSPQNFTLIIKELKKIKESGFSMSSFYRFIERFTELEKEKATSLVKKQTEESVQAMIKKYGDELFKPLEKSLTN